jgi:hypothetical protein
MCAKRHTPRSARKRRVVSEAWRLKTWAGPKIVPTFGAAERQLRTEDGIDVWPLDRFAAAAADGSL